MADAIEKQYEQYLGNWVKVSAGGGVRIGKLVKADYDWIELNPAVVDESIGNKKKDIKYRLEDKIPTTIKSGIVSVIESISDNFIDKLLKKYPVRD